MTRDFARGLAVGVFIWMMLGVTISGATWHLYDIAWVMVAVLVTVGVLATLLVVEAVRQRV